MAAHSSSKKPLDEWGTALRRWQVGEIVGRPECGLGACVQTGGFGEAGLPVVKGPEAVGFEFEGAGHME